MKDSFPDYWEEMANFIPEAERSDLMQAYSRRILSSDPAVRDPAAIAFMKYDVKCAFRSVTKEHLGCLEDTDTMVSLCVHFFHYAKNKFFLKENQIVDNIDIIKHLPLIIVQGRYDAITRSSVAYRLHKLWPGSKLVLVDDSGHSQMDVATSEKLMEATEQFKKL